jgi:sorting nexin-9/18/33
MESSMVPEVLRRTDVVSYALLAEINHFHSERAINFKLAMQNYLREQTEFYQQVCELCSAFYVLCCQGILGC